MIHILLFAWPVLTKDLFIDFILVRVARNAHMSINHWNTASSKIGKCDQHIWKANEYANALPHNKSKSGTVKKAQNSVDNLHQHDCKWIESSACTSMSFLWASKPVLDKGSIPSKVQHEQLFMNKGMEGLDKNTEDLTWLVLGSNSRLLGRLISGNFEIPIKSPCKNYRLISKWMFLRKVFLAMLASLLPLKKRQISCDSCCQPPAYCHGHQLPNQQGYPSILLHFQTCPLSGSYWRG